MATYFRSDQASIGVTVSGIILDNLSWDVLEGGEQSVDGVTVLPGGMAPQVPLGGIPKRATATVKRLWAESLVVQYKALDEVAGNAAVTVTYQVLGTNKAPARGIAPITYTGVLANVMRPNYDAMKSEAAYLEITVDLAGALN